jgi:HAD superfamily hydrolase (TIGR01490 family)
MALAFFDVDKTLMKGYSGFYTTLILIQKGILKKRRLPLALYYRLMSRFYEGGQANLKRLYEIAIADMAGRAADEIWSIGRECFERWIRPRIYTEALNLVSEHKKKGDGVYLLTSGPTMVVRLLAEFLGADGQYSSGPVIGGDGRMLNEVRLPIYYREGKVAAAEDLLKKTGRRWEECYFYSDSIDDIFLLEKVGHPHLVNPDPKLLRIGRKRQWPVLRFSRLLGKKSGIR